MKKILLFLLLLSLKGFSQNVTSGEERPLGIIFSSGSFSSLTGWTQNGGTWSTSGGKITCSTGAGTFTQSLDYTAWGPSCLPTWHFYTRASVSSISGAFGFGHGKRSTNTYGAIDAVARTSMLSSSTAILNLGTTHAQSVQSSAFAVSNNDEVELITDMDGYTITTTVRNVTTNSAPLTISYPFQTYPNADPYLPNTGNFAIYAFGGSLAIDSVCISSNTPVNSSLAIIGDSKVAGYDVTAQGFRISDQVNKYVKSTINLGGGFDRTTDVSQRINEIIKLHPKVALNLILSNDVRTGVSAGTYEARYDSINTALKGAGIRVLTGVLYESSVNMSVAQAYIKANYPSANFIDFYDQMQRANVLDVDNVHPLNYGDSIAANLILQSYSFYNQSPRYTPSEAAAYNWTGPHSYYSAPGLIPINVKSFGTTSNNIQAGSFGVQSVAVNNGFIQENLYFNGSASTYLNAGFGDVMQFSGGDIWFKTAISGAAGATAALSSRLTIKNNGVIIAGSTTDQGYGSMQVIGSQGFASYYDATHDAVYQSDASGNALLGSTTHKFLINAVDNSTACLQVMHASLPQLALHYDNTHYTTFAESSAGVLTIAGNGTPSSIVTVTQTGSGTGLSASAGTGGIAIQGAGTTGDGVQATATSGIGIAASSTSGTAATFTVNPASTNTVVTNAGFSRSSSAPAATGIGQSLDFSNQTTTGALPVTNQIVTKLTDATNATVTSQIIFRGVTGGNAIADLVKIDGNGNITTVGAHIDNIVLVSATGTYNALATDYIIVFTGSTATLVYPTAVTGRRLMLVNQASGTITIPTTTIGNASTSTSMLTNTNMQVVYDGSVWRKIN